MTIDDLIASLRKADPTGQAEVLVEVGGDGAIHREPAVRVEAFGPRIVITSEP